MDLRELRCDELSEACVRCALICDESGSPVDYRLLELNRPFCRLAEMDYGQFDGKTASECLPEALEDLDLFAGTVRDGKARAFSLRLIRAHRFVKGIVFRTGLQELTVLFTDYTRQRERFHSLAKYKMLFENSQNCIFFINDRGRIMEANQRAVDTYGYTAEEFMQMAIVELRGENERAEYQKQFDRAMCEGMTFETVHRKKNGALFPVEVSSRGVSLGGEKILMSIIHDISGRKKMEEELNFRANHDHLTQIPNRRFIMSRFLPLCEETAFLNGKLAVLFFDIDKFKHINDRYGHEAGDAVLVEIARRISWTASGIAGRLGGDEFVILQPFTSDRKEVRRLVDTIFHEFDRPISWDGCEIRVTTSIGIAVYPDDSEDRDHLMSLADNAMYEAKVKSGNSYAFHDGNYNGTDK